MSNGAPQTQGERVVNPGLVAVHCEGKVYVGKIDVKNEETGRIILREAIELLFQRKVAASGKVESSIMPAHVFPTNGPTTIELWVAIIVPIGETQELVEMYANATNRPALVIPGLR